MNRNDTPRAQVTRTVPDVSSTESLTRTLVTAIAAAKETSIADLDTSLYDVVSPEALSRVLSSSPDSRVAFRYGDARVVTYGDGTVVVDTDPSFADGQTAQSPELTPEL